MQSNWAFLVVVLVVIIAPGVDFVITLRNTVAGGRRAGLASLAGIFVASMTQATLVSFGLGAVIVQSQPVFVTIQWLGIAYLAYLGITSLLSAWRGAGDVATDAQQPPQRVRRAFREGLLTNITNPKVLVFYLSLLPQFVEPTAPIVVWLAHAWVLPIVGSAWLVLVILAAGAMREKLLRPLARRITDAVSGIALLGLGVRLAAQSH